VMAIRDFWVHPQPSHRTGKQERAQYQWYLMMDRIQSCLVMSCCNQAYRCSFALSPLNYRILWACPQLGCPTQSCCLSASASAIKEYAGTVPIPLVLPANEIRDLLILRLLDRRLIALITLAESVLLDCIDAYVTISLLRWARMT